MSLRHMARSTSTHAAAAGQLSLVRLVDLAGCRLAPKHHNSPINVGLVVDIKGGGWSKWGRCNVLADPEVAAGMHASQSRGRKLGRLNIGHGVSKVEKMEMRWANWEIILVMAQKHPRMLVGPKPD